MGGWCRSQTIIFPDYPVQLILFGSCAGSQSDSDPGGQDIFTGPPVDGGERVKGAAVSFRMAMLLGQTLHRCELGATDPLHGHDHYYNIITRVDHIYIYKIHFVILLCLHVTCGACRMRCNNK